MSTTSDTRRELLAVLADLSQLRPEWRLGQTLANLAMTAGRMESGAVWDLEDEEALAAAKVLIEQYATGATEPDDRSSPTDRGNSSSSPGDPALQRPQVN